MLGVPYFLGLAVAVAAIAGFCDWRTGEIPNRVTLWPLVIAPIAHFAAPLLEERSVEAAIDGAGFSLLGAIACAAVPLMMWRLSGGKAMGGGDVKLFAALGAILRPSVGIEAEFYSFFAALLIAPARLAYEGKLLRVLGNTLTLAVNPFLPRHKRREISPEMLTSMRFGPAIFIGTCTAAFTHWRVS
ncbi:MAG TPA: A24 family peptidase [Candidatus Nanopelagicales bacterium]|nr:A24 family peptidase [Candidatus Nanopelagicales bacterium]